MQVNNEEKLFCEHISVSRKQCWDECQAKYKYRYHLKITPDVPEQPYFGYGKLIHKIAETYVEQQGKVDIQSIANDCLSGKIQVEENKPPFVLSGDYISKFPKHVESIKKLSDKIGYDGHIEWGFDYDLDPPNNLCIVGFIDRLIVRNGEYYIIDYKTSKISKYRKNPTTIKTDLQLRMYARIVQKTFNVSPDKIKAALYYLEGEELVAAKFSEQALIDAEKELYDAYKHILNTNANNVFYNSGYHCSRCDYRNVCPVYKK